jgi:hypothetical protein
MRTLNYLLRPSAPLVLWFLVLLQSSQALIALEQSQPAIVASPSTQKGKIPSDAIPARIVIVEWRIKKGSEQEFLEYWSVRSTIPNRSGLIGEFLSRVEDRSQYPWIIWDFDERWTTFINVGFWRGGADFQEQVGKFIDNTRPPLAFEADRRRRLFVAPERWRIGATPLPVMDHQEVR